MKPLQTKRKEQSAQSAGNPCHGLRLHNSRLVKALAQVEDQMPAAVDEVVGEGEAQQELDSVVHHGGHVGEGLGQRGALDVPAEQGSDEVRCEVDVRGAGEGAAGDTGPGGVAEPGLVELIDAQMGRDRAVETLLGEDVVAFGGGKLRGIDGPAVVSLSLPPCCFGRTLIASCGCEQPEQAWACSAP